MCVQHLVERTDGTEWVSLHTLNGGGAHLEANLRTPPKTTVAATSKGTASALCSETVNIGQPNGTGPSPFVRED